MLPVLTYHRVKPDGPWMVAARHPNVVSTSEFDREVAYLVRHYHVVTGEEFRGFVTRGVRLPAHSVLITFDDGYADNYREAFPVLRQHGATAMFFVVSGFIGATSRRLWFDELDALLREPVPLRVAAWLRSRGVPRDQVTCGDLRAWAKRLSRANRQQLVQELRRAFGQTPPPGEDEPMTWAEAGAMADAGMTIGSHTATHQILAAASRQEVCEELVASRSRIEAAIGRRCWAFSYPNGERDDYTGTNLRAVREAGYDCAFTQHGGFVTSASDVYALPRVSVPGAGGFDAFQSRLTGIVRLVDAVRLRSAAQ